MFSIARILTEEKKKASPDALKSLYGETSAEESFLRDLIKFQKVYFDWDARWFWILINSDGDIKDEKNWNNINSECFMKITCSPSNTTTDIVIAIARLGVEVVIFNSDEQWGLQNEEEKTNYLDYLKEIDPELKVSFYRK